MSNNTNTRAKHWCFTLNNYTNEHLTTLRNALARENTPKITFLLFGREVAPDTQTPHLQGFVSFQEKTRRNQILRILPQCHLSSARNIPASIEYCKKEGDYEEFGDSPLTHLENRGHRTDLDAFKTSVEEGTTDLSKLYSEHSEVCAKYPSFVRSYLHLKAPKPHPRHIVFIIDHTGNAGKTWYAQYYCSLHENAQYILPGKKADMAHLLSLHVRVIFIDCPRSKQGEQIQYNFLEECKNGVVFASKYESVNKYLKPLHVVVLLNEIPDETKLSKDRYVTCTINSEDTSRHKWDFHRGTYLDNLFT
jgi:Putative viral replication protein